VEGHLEGAFLHPLLHELGHLLLRRLGEVNAFGLSEACLLHVLDDIVAVFRLVDVDGLNSSSPVGEDFGVADDRCDARPLLEAVHVDEAEAVFLYLDDGDNAVVDSFHEVYAHVEAPPLLRFEAEELELLAAALRQEVLAEPGVDVLDELGLVLHLEDLGTFLPLPLQLLEELLRVAVLSGGVSPCDDVLLVVGVMV
jgi:hypothetical protein